MRPDALAVLRSLAFALAVVLGQRLAIADLNGDSTADSFVTRHTTDLRHQLSHVKSTLNGSTAEDRPIVHDRAGNLVFDGRYVYQYDCFNHLNTVSLLGTAVFDDDGQITSGTLGRFVAHFAYDGLGRMISKSRPWPWPNSILDDNYVQAEQYYYDGARRIHEVWTSPIVVPTGGEDGLSLADLVALLSDPETTPGSLPGITSFDYQARQYVYGPGYIDELVAECAGGPVHYVMQDAGYDVMGLVVSESWPSGPHVSQQYSWDAYGEPLAAERFADAIESKLGHKGLFFDRLDGGVVELTTAELVPSFGPGAGGGGFFGLYGNRNRVYFPAYARFGQIDPNGAGMLVLRLTSMGCAIQVDNEIDCSETAMANTSKSIYVSSNPANDSDPEGLMDFSIAGQSAMMAMDSWDSAKGQMEEALQGLHTAFGLWEMLQGYRTMQSEDADWAADWSNTDFEYNGAGVAAAAYGGAFDTGDSEFDNSWLSDYDAAPTELSGPTTDETIYVGVHPNSGNSTAINHLYKIKYKMPGSNKWRTAKYGISSTLPMNGQSKRALRQIKGFESQKRFSNWQFKHEIVKSNIHGRRAASVLERTSSNRYLNRAPGGLPFHSTPRPFGR